MSTRSALLQPLHLLTSSPLPAKIPCMIYGCAWKKDSTASLVHAALRAGFRGIDVAAQPRHYREDLAGEGVRAAIADGTVTRSDLYLQTKFSPPAAQDPSTAPYALSDPLPAQVEASVQSSLRNLRTDDSGGGGNSYIDTLVLHSPLATPAETLQAWQAMSRYLPDRVRQLGISNVNLSQLEHLWNNTTDANRPAVVQNRFWQESGYDADLRRFCAARGMIYQSFWTLTANPRLLRSAPVTDVAEAADVGAAVALYALVLGLENTVLLNGTKTHMDEDVAGLQKVSDMIESENGGVWKDALRGFKTIVGDADSVPRSGSV